MNDQPTTSTLDYASRGALRPRGPHIDASMLLIGIAQTALALVMCIGWMIAQSSAGHHELKRFQGARLPALDVGWLDRLAWNLFGPTNPATLVMWLVASFAMTVGAITLSPAVRLRCYRVGAGIIFGAIAVMLIALLILDSRGISERWVHPPSGRVDGWDMIVIERIFYWQFPLVALIANPALILLAVRRARRLGTGTRSSEAI